MNWTLEECTKPWAMQRQHWEAPCGSCHSHIKNAPKIELMISFEWTKSEMKCHFSKFTKYIFKSAWSNIDIIFQSKIRFCLLSKVSLDYSCRPTNKPKQREVARQLWIRYYESSGTILKNMRLPRTPFPPCYRLCKISPVPNRNSNEMLLNSKAWYLFISMPA